MIRLSVLFLALFSLGSFHAFSQSVEQLVQYADHQFDNARYELAAREYQRALFFGEKEKVASLNIKTGDCYYKLKRYQDAEKYYRFAANILGKDSLHAEAILRKSTCQLMTGNYRIGQFDLLSLQTNEWLSLEKRKNMLLGIAYFATADFQKSRSYLDKLIPENDAMIKDQLDALFSSKKLRRPNPTLAYYMSMFLPGSGQIYSGDWKNGLNSLLLTGSLLAMGGRIAVVQSPWDAFFTIFPWLQRYFVGGYNSAREIAEKQRQRNRAAIYREVYDLVYPLIQAGQEQKP